MHGVAARGAGRRIAVDAGRLNNATASDRATWALTQGTTASVQYKSHQKALSLGPPTTVGWLAGRLSRTLVARVGAPPDCTGSFIMWRCGLSRVRWQLAGGSRRTSVRRGPKTIICFVSLVLEMASYLCPPGPCRGLPSEGHGASDGDATMWCTRTMAVERWQLRAAGPRATAS